MEGFCRKEGEARKLSAKEKKGVFQARSLSLMGKGRGLIKCTSSSSSGGMERAHVKDNLMDADLKVPG